MAEENDEIDFDDLDFGDDDASSTDGPADPSTGDALDDLDDLDDLDLGGSDTGDGEEGDSSESDLFDDLEAEANDQKGETKGEAQEGGSGKKAKANPASLWQYPVLIAAIVAGILHFVVFPPSETKGNKIQDLRDNIALNISDGRYSRAKHYLKDLLILTGKYLPEEQLTLADAEYGIAKIAEANPTTKFNAAGHYKKAKNHYRVALDEYKDKWTPVQTFYIDYQIARSDYNIQSYQKALMGLEDLQEQVDKENRKRMQAERKGQVIKKIPIVWSEKDRLKYPLSEPRIEILNYIGQSNEKLRKYQEAISAYKRFADASPKGKKQLSAWKKIGESYFMDNDREQSRIWFEKSAHEYSHLPESKEAFYRLGLLLRDQKEYDQARLFFEKSKGSPPADTYNPQANYYIARCDLDNGQYQQAEDLFYTLSVDPKSMGQELGVASLLRIADTHDARDIAGIVIGEEEKKLLADDEPKTYLGKAFNQYKDVVNSSDGSMVKPNPYFLELRMVNKLTNMANRAGLRGQYKLEIDIYKFIVKHFEADQDFVLEKMAQAYMARAAPLLEKRDELKQAMKEKDAHKAETRAFNYFIEAGKIYRKIKGKDLADGKRLAMLKAGQLFWQAKAWLPVESLYSKYSTNYPSESQTPKSDYRLGYAQLALGKYEEAEMAFDKNIRNSEDSLFSYYSRYELGRLQLARGTKESLDKAIKQFTDIIEDQRFSPDSQVWRDSIFALSHTLFTQKSYDKSIKYGLEAVERYQSIPDQSSTVFKTRYELGMAYAKSKKYPDSRQHLQQVMQSQAQNDTEKNMQRYAGLSIADGYKQEKDYENALKTYGVLFNRYRQHRDAPWIRFMMGTCHEHMGRADAAQASYKNAIMLYKALQKKADKDLPEDLKTQFWSDYVNWTSKTQQWHNDQSARNKDFFKSLLF